MLDVARSKFEGSEVHFIHSDFMKLTNLANSPFDMTLMSLVLEHFSDLQAVFKKIRAQLKVGSRLYLSEIHPDRASSGILAHFVDESGEQIDLASSPHTELDIRKAAEKSGFFIEVVRTVCGNNDLSKANPKWEKYLDVPMIQQWKMRVAK